MGFLIGPSSEIPGHTDYQSRRLMSTALKRLCFKFAIAAILFLAVAAVSLAESTSSPDADVAEGLAQALLKEGRPTEALTILRPLLRSHPEYTNIRFLVALAAIEASREPGVAPSERQALLKEAVTWLREMLVDQPALVRVRLELARAFFYLRKDNLAHTHFEHVLAGKPPAPVAANVQRFLDQIRARRGWSMYMGMSLSPDTNIGAASNDETIYIFDLPFRRNNADEVTTSGTGVLVWAGSEYQHSLGNRLRLRAGVDVAHKEHSGRQFDASTLSAHAGPRWLMDRQTDLSVLASAHRRWVGGRTDHNATGARIEAHRRLTSQVSTSARASWHWRDYKRQADLDGPVIDMSLSGTWTISPTLQSNSAIGYSRERPQAQKQRNDSRWVRLGLSIALPRSFNTGVSVQMRWTDYQGNWFPFTSDGLSRKDHTRTLSIPLLKRDLMIYGFSPQLVVTHETRDSNAQLHDYDRTRGEIRLIRQF